MLLCQVSGLGFHTKRISCLYAEALDDTVEGDTAVVPIPAVGGEILNCFGAVTGEQLHTDVPSGGMDDSSSGECVRVVFFSVRCLQKLGSWFLIEYIPTL